MERQPTTPSMCRNHPSCCYIAAADDDDDHNHHPRPSGWFNPSLDDDMEAVFSHHRRRKLFDSLFRKETRRYEYKEPHFLDSCYLCKNTLCENKDIFMYRGDIAFCSKECRQEQIEMDQQRERNTSLSSSVRVAMRNKGQKGRSTSPSESPEHPRLCTDTVIVA